MKGIELPSPLWHYHSDGSGDRARVCKIVSSNVTTSQSTIISLCLEIKSNLTWSRFVHNRQVDENCAALSSVPKCLDVTSLSRLLSLLETMPVCPGHPDTHFLEMVDAKKWKQCGQSGNVVAYTDNYASVHLMVNSILKLFGQLPAICSFMVENAHHARSTVLISEHSLLSL